MKTARLQVQSQEEVERIDQASLEILSTVGVQLEWPPAQRIFQEAGAEIAVDVRAFLDGTLNKGASGHTE